MTNIAYISWIFGFLFMGSASAFSCESSSIGVGGSVLLCFAPLVLFLALIFWGLEKNVRKQAVMRTGYLLIAIDVILCGLVPIANDGDSCFGFYWILFPASMIILVLLYALNREAKEKRHVEALRAMRASGHLDPGVQLDAEVKREEERPKEEKKVEPAGKKTKEKYLSRFKPPPGFLGKKTEEEKPKVEPPPDEEPQEVVQKAENVHFELEDETTVEVEPKVRIEEETKEHREMEKIISKVLEKSQDKKK